ERARDSGEPAASGKVILKQEIDPAVQPGFLIYLPVYKGGEIPATMVLRQQALLGFVYSPFRVGDLLDRVFNEENNPGVDFGVTIGDDKSADEVLFHSASKGRDYGRRTRPLRSRTMMVAGQP